MKNIRNFDTSEFTYMKNSRKDVDFFKNFIKTYKII